MWVHNSDECVHRVGGGDEKNLGLKPHEAKLDPPGISVLIGGTPAETAAAFRRVFGPKSSLGKAARTIGTAEIEQIRAAGFDVVPVPTSNFPNHERLIHPTEGAAGFTQDNLAEVVSGFHQLDRAMTMAESKKVLLIGSDGNTLAELLIADEEEGWFTGRVISPRFPFAVKKALVWYDEVVRDQMLSYLDEATAAIEQFEIQANFPNGQTHRIYSLHVSPLNEVSFRVSPVSPPLELPKETVI